MSIRQPCAYEKLLLQYYVNNRYSDVSCMSMRSSELTGIFFFGNTNWIFSKQISCEVKNYNYRQLRSTFIYARMKFSLSPTLPINGVRLSFVGYLSPMWLENDKIDKANQLLG